MIKTEGIVLGEIKFKDSSKILSIYTKNIGKISVLAQGAYRPKSQLLSVTQPFSYCEFQLRKGKSFYYIAQVDLIDSFYSIREQIERIVYGFYILELIDKGIPDEEENIKLFLLLEKGLSLLSKLNKDFIRFIIAYELKFISFIGYRPQLSNCVICGREIKNEGIRFSRILGGTICSHCYTSDLSSKSVNSELIKTLDTLMYTSLDELDKLLISEENLRKLHNILVQYILYNIDSKEFKSLALISEL